MKEKTNSSEWSKMSGVAKDRASEWKVLHATASHFRVVLNNKTYCLLEKSQF